MNNNLIKKNSLDLVSIITPAYNAEKFINETIESVIAQTYEKWEMIIVDDCSTDSTREIIKKYIAKDNRIKLIKLEVNSGPAVTRNTAIKNSCGRYLAFLDSDDQWLPEKLERQLAFMKSNSVAFSFSKYVNVNEEGESLGKVVSIPDKVTYNQLLKQNVIGCLTVILDTDVIDGVEMVNIRSRQDYTLWLNLTKRGYQAYGFQEVLAKYRIVDQSLSSNKIKMARQNWKVYREIEKLGTIKSIWYFMHYLYFKIKKYIG